MEKDPTRLCDCASGWSDRPCGSVHDMHRYPGPGMPEPEEDRAVVLGEFGGLGLPFPEHAWKKDGNWGYVSFADQDGLRILERVLEPYGSGLVEDRFLIPHTGGEGEGRKDR